jgi:hypothetical protein
LQNNAILQSCSDLLSMFDPIAHALNLTQKKCCTLAESVDIWIELTKNVPKKSGALEAVMNRSKQALECPFFLLANVLDHRFSGKQLSASQIRVARDFADTLGPEIGTALTSYLARTDPFSEALFAQTGDPAPWWQAGRLSGFPQALSAVAMRLCACIASSATLERNFSTMGLIPHYLGFQSGNYFYSSAIFFM